MIRVFISSVQKELAEERRAVKAFILKRKGAGRATRYVLAPNRAKIVPIVPSEDGE
jgi:hypothetical protein